MNLVAVLILVAVVALAALLVLSPAAPVRRNPFPGLRPRGADRRPTGAGRASTVPGQRGLTHRTH